MSLYKLIDALAKRFGQVNLENRQDDYAVIRVVFNESQKMKGMDDSMCEPSPTFSSVVEFVNHNQVFKDTTNSFRFMSARNASMPVPSRDSDAYQVKVFSYSEKS